MSKVMHINMYDTIPWCEAEYPFDDHNDCTSGGAPSEPDGGDCYACLDAIMAYGSRAMARKLELVQADIAALKTRKENAS